MTVLLHRRLSDIVIIKAMGSEKKALVSSLVGLDAAAGRPAFRYVRVVAT